MGDKEEVEKFALQDTDGFRIFYRKLVEQSGSEETDVIRFFHRPGSNQVMVNCHRVNSRNVCDHDQFFMVATSSNHILNSISQDLHTVHSETAILIADQYYKTQSAIKYYGDKAIINGLAHLA